MKRMIIPIWGGGDVIFIHGCRFDAPRGWFTLNEQYTLVKDLSQDNDKLFSSICKRTRQYIRNFSDNSISFRFYESENIIDNSAILKSCKKLYERMHKDKGMDSLFNTILALEYAKKGNLIAGIAYENDIPIGFECMVHDSNSARGWTLAFDFRNEKYDADYIGKIHKKFEWEKLLYLKGKGITSYDFGGINSFESPDGIAKFKMEFEKDNLVTYTNFLAANTFIGRLALSMYKIKKKLV